MSKASDDDDVQTNDDDDGWKVDGTKMMVKVKRYKVVVVLDGMTGCTYDDDSCRCTTMLYDGTGTNGDGER